MANWWNNNLWEASSPSQFNFLIFAACWTLLYLVVAFLPFPVLKHKFIVLGAEFVTMLFWFAGFIAAAAWLTDHPCFGSVCSAAKAADVFAAFSW